MKKKALITGITRHDGSLLVKFLLKKNFKLKPQSSLNQLVDNMIKDEIEKLY